MTGAGPEPAAAAAAEEYMPEGALLTWSGRVVRPLEDDPGVLTIVDIAEALSRIARFGGHSTGGSVGEHSLLVAEILARRGESARTQLYGLLHDAAEAYLGDIPSPLKRRLHVLCQDRVVPFADVEESLLRRIWDAVIPDELQISEGVDEWRLLELIHAADVDALAAEREAYLPAGGPRWRSLEAARPIGRKLGPPSERHEVVVRFLRTYETLVSDALRDVAAVRSALGAVRR